jgi:RimJ/RimL family protein N-acetyltransferase
MLTRLNTPRLLLREPLPGDELAAFQQWAQDIDVLRWLGWRPHSDVEQTRRQLAWDSARWLKRSACTWMLVPADTSGRPVGQVQLIPQQLDGPAHHWRLGFLLARSHQRQGLMHEALRAVIDHALAQPQVWRVDALCDVENAASARLLAGLGLQREGRLACCLVHPNAGAEPRDVWMFAAVKRGPPPD